ncbi:BCS1 N terminal-domain-containing protein [Lactarius indigo]|nr:BCS1 N terminal-domain-containing protein [Lactarius indigo]
MDALKSLVQPLVGNVAGNSVVDGMKLVVLGGTVETARRMSSSAWSSFVNSFFLTAHFSEEDYPYEWLMLWLSRRPEWQRSREFETTTNSSSPGFYGYRESDSAFSEEERVDDEPTSDTTHTIFYRGHWLRVRRGRKSNGYEMLSISVVARSNSILKQLVLQAKKEYEAEAVHRIQIYFADSYGSWRYTDSRHKRPLSSIVLNPGVKEMLVADAKDFLKSEKWYADRGIPFRRGYLLYGVPGSGNFMLDIYVVSLSSSWINDSTLTTLMGRVPSRCIVLLEDLDAAFTRSVSRSKDKEKDKDKKKSDSKSDNEEESTSSSSGRGRRNRNKENLSDVNTLTLSGLLNALDVPTNHLDQLDPALCRPGRMDVWIEFKNASKFQAQHLFRNFFPSSDAEAVANIELETELEPLEMPAPSSPATSQLSSLFSEALSGLSSASSRSGSLSPLSSPTPVGSHSRSRRSESVSSRAGAKSEASELSSAVEEHVAACAHAAPPLSAARLAQLAKQFADSIPDEGFSVAALQGYLLKNKSRPETAAEGAAAWVITERELREKLKKEREAKERELEKEEKEREEEEKRAAEAEKEKEAKADDAVVEPVNDENAAPATADGSSSSSEVAEDQQADKTDDNKSTTDSSSPSDAGVTWVRVAETSEGAEVEAEADSSS